MINVRVLRHLSLISVISIGFYLILEKNNMNSLLILPAMILVPLSLYFYFEARRAENLNIRNTYSRIKSYIISHLDSTILIFIYATILILITSGIIYLTNNLIGLSMQQSLFILLLYYVLEVGALFFSLPFREYPTLKEPRSWPTSGILLSTPFALIYLSIRYRYIDFCKLEGIYITWALTRYNIVNPIWLRPQEQTENYDGGIKGMLSKLDKKPASCSMTSSS